MDQQTSPVTKKENEKFCSECAALILAKAEICPKCGVRQTGNSSQFQLPLAPNGKSKIVAGALAILLGGFGGHKFYLQQPGLGILYFLFSWTFIPSIIALIEGIMFLTMSDEQFIQQHGLK